MKRLIAKNKRNKVASDETETKKITEQEVQDNIYELILNNSNIEGEEDDSLVFANIKNVFKSGNNHVLINMEDDTEVEISIQVR